MTEATGASTAKSAEANSPEDSNLAKKVGTSVAECFRKLHALHAAEAIWQDPERPGWE